MRTRASMRIFLKIFQISPMVRLGWLLTAMNFTM